MLADAEGRLLCVNRRANALFGYEDQELEGQTLNVLVPEWFEHAQQLLRSATYLADHLVHAPEDLFGRRRDGAEFRIHLIAGALVGATPALVGVAMRQAQFWTPDLGVSPEAFDQQVDQATRALARAFAHVEVRLAAERQNEALRKQAGTTREALATAAAQVRALQTITDTALAHLDLDDLLPALLDRVRDTLEIDNAIVFLLDEDGDGNADGQPMLLAHAARGPESAQAIDARVPVGAGFVGRIAATREPLIAEDLSAYPDMRRRLQERVHSAAGAPLLLQERVVGALCVTTAEPRQFTREDVELLQRVAERVTVAIERAQRYEAERQARAEAEAAHAEAQTARAEAMRQAEQLDRIVEAMGEGLFVYDAEGQVIRTNAAARRLLGLDAAPPEFYHLPPEERLAQYAPRTTDGRLLSPQDWLELRTARHADVLREPEARDIRLRTLDGRELDVSASVAPLRDSNGQVMGGVLLLSDRTEQNRLAREREEALVASEAWFHTLTDTAPVLVWVSGVDGAVTFVNLPWLQFTGRSLEQELGNGWAEGVHSDDYDRCLQTYRAAFEARRTFTMEYRLRRFDGEYRWIVDNGVPRFAPDGTFLGYVGSVIDVSERRKLEQEREEARASELALREVNQRLDTFVTMAAHDLRRPVTVSKMRVELAKRQVLRAAANIRDTARDTVQGAAARTLPFIQVAHDLEVAQLSLDRLAEFMEQLLDVTRARQGTLVLNRQPCDLLALVGACVEEQRLLTSNRIMTLDLPDTLDLAGRTCMVDADVDRLSQALTNYLTNAERYSPEDRPIEIALRIVAQSTEGASRRVVRVSVRDHGSGILPEAQQGIWDRFQRAHNMREGNGGLGLGLYIARMIIELHGGAVGLESALGEGSTFWLTLPLAPAAD